MAGHGGWLLTTSPHTSSQFHRHFTSTFSEDLFFELQLQTQNVSTESFAKLLVKCWWNWDARSFLMRRNSRGCRTTKRTLGNHRSVCFFPLISQYLKSSCHTRFMQAFSELHKKKYFWRDYLLLTATMISSSKLQHNAAAVTLLLVSSLSQVAPSNVCKRPLHCILEEQSG